MIDQPLTLWITLALLIVPGVAGFSAGTPCHAEEPIVFGALYNSSGIQSGLDIPSSKGAELAVAEANRTGGVLGRRVLLEIRDGRSDAEVVSRQTSSLLNHAPAPVALFGLSDTDLVLAAAPLAARSGRVFVTSGATSPRLPAQVPEYLFLACFGDNVQASAAAEWIHKERSARTAVILFDAERTYTRLLHQYFQTRFQELGGRITANRGFVSTDLEESLQDLPEADVVFLAAEVPGDIRKAIRLLRGAGASCPILGGDSFDSEGLWEHSSDVTEVYYTTHAYLGEDNRNPRVVAFRKAYVEAYPDTVPDAFAALGFDTARLLMHAIEQAQSTDPDAIRRALANTREFAGVTGSISYSNGSRIPAKSVAVIGVSEGKHRLVQELIPDRVPPP